MAQALPGHVYAEVRDGVLYRKFTSLDTPEWVQADNEGDVDALFVVDITRARPMPLEGWLWGSTGFTAPLVQTPLAQLINSTRKEVDNVADEVYQSFAASPGRAQEYAMAQSQAQAYKDAGYTGTPGAMIASWSAAARLTAQESADSILTAATQLNAVIAAIRSIRLHGKQAIAAQETEAGIISTLQATLANLRALQQ